MSGVCAKNTPPFPDAKGAASHVGVVVRSRAGRDAGRLFVVIAADMGKTERPEVFIADGGRRKLASPKRKNLAHLAFLGYAGDETALAIANGSLTDKKLRTLLKTYRYANDANET